VTNAGWDTKLHGAVEPGFTAAHGRRMQLGYVALAAAILLLRALRNAHERHRGSVRIDYSVGRSIWCRGIFRYWSRWAEIPHASVCGGRGRCSIWRVGVFHRLEQVAPPAAAELVTLQRILDGANSRLRLGIAFCLETLVDLPTRGLGIAMSPRP
jgi:adenylate cyclase